MIKFFRKIRQNLLMENKTGKYFKYAIGEIVLVVIGILIALQINNWNTERIQNIESREIAKRLLLETNQNKVFLKSGIDTADKTLHALLQFLKMTGNNYKEKSITKTDSLIYQIIPSPRLNLNTSVLEQAISMGRLAHIKSDSLRNLIYELPSAISKIKDNLLFVESHDERFLMKRYYKLISLREVDGKFSAYANKLGRSNFSNIDNRIILNDMQFESMVDNKYFNIRLLLDAYIETQKILNKLGEMLSKEINNK
ncbi:MAG: hypothetical protein ACI8WA_001223 [Polaribacter sp.]|jgi:hypothetical protein